MMIICTGCGHANGEQDAFCGSCGGFLEWDGEAVTTTHDDHSVRVAARVAPAADDEPVDAPDVGRAPEVELERPAPVRPDPVDLGPADVYCGACGAGNATGRSFCRRCGAELADAVASVRPPWWRRAWHAVQDRFGRRRTYAAGERPQGWSGAGGSTEGGRSRRRWRPRLPTRLSLGRMALPLALLSLVGFGIAPVRAMVTEKAFGAYHEVRGVVAPRFVPVSASGATATSAQDGHAAAAAIDQNTLTWWAEGAVGRGRGARLVVRFDRPVDLDRMTVHNGAAEAAYPFQPRVRGLRVTLRGPDGAVGESRLVLADRRGLQELEVSGSGVTTVTLRVLSTYAGQKGTAASLAEVGFFSKQ